MKNKNFKNALLITFIYFFISLLWIYFSDQAVALLAQDSDTAAKLQTYKGLLYITFISIILFFLSYQFFRKEYLIYQKNIKKQKQTKIELLQQQAIFESIAEGVYAVDTQNRCTYINKSALTMLLQTRDAVIHGYPHDIFHHHTIDGAPFEADSCLIHQAILSGKPTRLEDHFIRSDGSVFPVFVTVSPIYDNVVLVGSVVTFIDITTQKQHEQNILEAKHHFDVLAHEDILTQLPNRLSLIEYLQQKCTKNDPFGFLFLDLDGFKEINDSYGHRFGDQLLISIAEILRSILPPESYLVRMGGDEFVIILDCQQDKSSITLFLDNFFQKLSHPVMINQTDVYVDGSIGIAMYPTDAKDYENLLQKADAAMYHAKKEGHLKYSFYESRFIQKVIKRTTLSTQLKKALNNQELTLYYQPQINVHTNQIEGVEALCRWFTPQGAIPPGEFIPIAEESGLILDIGHFALSQSSIMAKQWYEQSCILGHVAVNVSAKQLSHPDFLTTLDEIVATHQCSPHCIEIEITESSILENPEKMLDLLHSIKERGYYLSMDDFGTGYSSLSYLKDLPIDKLKIDQSFVRNIIHNPKNQIIVKTIIDLGKGLGMRVLAEGVETQEEFDFLRVHGIDSVQGYYFHRPLPIHDLNTLFKPA